MTIHLKPEQEHRIDEALRSGAYGSRDEVIDRALEVLHEQDEWLTAERRTISAKIRTGIEELEPRRGHTRRSACAYSNDVDQSNRFDADQIGAKRRKAFSV